jgi:hypothetical protein
MTCNDGKQKHVVEKEKIKMVDERERDKNQICNGGRRAEKYEITTGLFSRRECHILDL